MTARLIQVRILVTGNQAARDAVIRATNRQTTVPVASLRATDDIQRQIESYFYDRGWSRTTGASPRLAAPATARTGRRPPVHTRWPLVRRSRRTPGTEVLVGAPPSTVRIPVIHKADGARGVQHAQSAP
ncbi:AIPR family protein [Streptomyces shenzhenensis]|uniref:AIPR family protein n=1 Tax=Streptomyces shenzhenensis TaxID=943815 RepID=UPI002867DECE|nr:AIPR family protein [Streptomyces shenzhenensis]